MSPNPTDIERLSSTRTIDLTTYGRKSGRPSRIEIWWFHFEDRFIITGTPGKRDWLANVSADPSVVVHIGGLGWQGTAVRIEDPEFRRRFFTRPESSWYSTQTQLDRLVDTAPMIEIQLG